MHRSAVLIVPALWLALALPAAGPAAAGTSAQALFRIERSKNANVVQYDARLREDGSLVRDDPVDAYWLRLAGSGKRKELDWLARKLAYGFVVHWRGDGALELEMVAPIGRRVQVVMGKDGWEARTRVDGRECRIDRIFVQSIERRFRLPKVESIDFAGTDVETGEARTEHFVPN